MKLWNFLLSVFLVIGWMGRDVPQISDRKGVDSPSLAMEWYAPAPQFRVQGDGTIAIEARGFLQTATPGMPRLPFTSTLIALPPGVSPAFRVLEQEEESLTLPGPLAIAPDPVEVLRDPEGHPVGVAFAPARQRSPGPTFPLYVEAMGIIRGVRLARVVFYPLIWKEGSYRWIRFLRAEVAGQPFRFEDLLRSPQPLPSLRVQVQGAGSTRPEAFVEISTPGIYRLTASQLASVFSTTVSPSNLRLFRGNDEVAYAWEDGALLFYAEPRPSRWTRTDVYRLVADDGSGLLIESRSYSEGLDGTPWREAVWEENLLYTPDCFCGPLPLGRDGDRWAWAELKRPGNSTFQATFTISNVDSTKPATLTLWLIGFTSLPVNPDHRMAVKLNETSLGDVIWDGKTAITATLAVPPNVLKTDAPNTLTLSLPGISGVGIEGVWLDAFSILYAMGGDSLPGPVIFRTFPEGGVRRYRISIVNSSAGYRAYDITDPLRPVRVGIQANGQQVALSDPGDRPRRYIVVSNESISTPAVRPRWNLWSFHPGGEPSGADYLIITHPSFADALGPLRDLRREQMRVAVANVLGIYDAYGDGRPDPEAIRSFIADVYTRWSPRPLYVLLVGDGSFDPKQYRANSPPTFIPPYLAEVDPWGGETAADNRYACVDGSDNLPDLMIGRLPVSSVEQARRLIEKIVHYEAAPLPGGWNARVILVADDPDSAGDFPASSDSVANDVSPPFFPVRLYCNGASSDTSDCDSSTSASIREALLRAWNQGALIVQFTGHSSWQQWAHERFLHLDDVPALGNDRRWPVVLGMTCFTSAFHRPEPVLDEALVLRVDGGAVATWGATGLGVSTGHDRLAKGFYHAVFGNSVETIGEAVWNGKLALASSSPYRDLLDTFTLLGDPATQWNRAIVDWPVRLYLPLVARW